MFLLRPRFVITLAVVSGLLAVYGVYYYLKQQEARTANTAVPTFVSQRVVVAASDLPIGTTLGTNDLQIRLWPENLVPAGSFHQVEDLINRVIKTDLTAGEPLLASKLAPEGSTGGVSSLIPDGKRAVTVAVNVVSGVGGFILPGTKVDVLVTASLSGKSEERSTKTILQNVEVLAVDQTYQKKSDDPVEVKSVTLIVSPEEAEKLALASNTGTLQLALRSSADENPNESSGIALNELMKGPRKPEPRRVVTRPRKVSKPEPSTKIVEVIRANVRSEVEFEDDGESSGKDGRK
jgi:pilus assembly protein CpaB